VKTLLDDTVLITRATVETAVERLALSAAHGSVQLATVREWIEDGELKVTRELIPSWTLNGMQRVAYRKGSYGLAGRSWTNLSKRLRNSGFVLKTEQQGTVIKLYWKAY
jgi:hypothetical protein